MTTVEGRIAALERRTPARLDPADCRGDGYVNLIDQPQSYLHNSTPPPPRPPRRCRRCGGVHLVEFMEEIVDSPGRKPALT